MSVDAATVRRIAKLARIALAEGEIEHLRGELNAILAFIEQLSEVDVSGIEPKTGEAKPWQKEALRLQGEIRQAAVFTAGDGSLPHQFPVRGRHAGLGGLR